jgi:hypothetical protein
LKFSNVRINTILDKDVQFEHPYFFEATFCCILSLKVEPFLAIYRKLMKLLAPLFILICVLFKQSVNAQTVVTIPTSTAVSCDGIAYIDSSQSFTSWYWTDNAGNTIQNGLDTLYNLCEGTFILNYTDLSGPGADTFNIIENPCSFFSVNLIASTPSIGNQCNGELTFDVLNGTALYICEVALLNDPLNPIVLVLAAPNMAITALCSESYLVTVTDANGCTGSFITSISDTCTGFAIDIIDVQNETAQNACDGSITIGVSGGTPAYNYTWSNGVTTQSTNSLCSGTYELYVTDAIGCQATTSVSISDPCSNLMAYLSGTANTDTANCNGLIASAVYGGNGPYVYSWNNGATTDSLFNLCSGTYYLTVVDINGCSATAGFAITDSISGIAPLTVELFVFDETFSGACDGAASVIVSGGVQPYYFLHSNGVPASVAAFLCPGIYNITITDFVGDSITLPYVIAGAENIIFNLPYPDSTIVDSLYDNLAIENCDIDYNSVNAAYIYNASLAGFDSVTVTWVVYDSSGVNYITETYYFGGGNGVYSLSLSVYCPQKSVEQYLKVYDQLYISDELGLTESALNNLSVFPNPFSESVSIQFEKTGDYEIELLDLTGRNILSHKVMAQNTFILNGLNTLAKGEYLLYIQSGSESVVRKLVK